MASARPGGGYLAGEVIANRYVLERPLGHGGMGVVWVAHSRPLDVKVALKLLPDLLAEPDGVERMSREARAAARLGHPAIVRVLDFGTTESMQPFIAMELLSGEDLHSYQQRHVRIPATQAVSLLLPIMEGLAAAHRAGIVHRDVKPENVLLASDELGRTQPKLLDFGIAKVDCDRAQRLTGSGMLLGTPQYLSPEQAAGRQDVDHRTDIWSIGVVLSELVSGTPPFTGDNYNALLRKIIEDQAPLMPDAPPDDAPFWAIVKQCLQKDPEDRWQSMWMLGRELAQFLMDRGVESDASSRSLKEVWHASVPVPPPGRGQVRTVASPGVPTLPRQRALASGRTLRRGAGVVLLVGVTLLSWAAAQPRLAPGDRPPPIARQPVQTSPSTPLMTSERPPPPGETEPVSSPAPSPRTSSPEPHPEDARNHQLRHRPRTASHDDPDPEFGF